MQNVPARDVRIPEPPPPARPRHKRLVWGLIAAAAAIGVGLWWWLSHRNQVSTDDAQVDGHITSVSSRVAGNVLQVFVDVNWHVNAGQVLVRLDPRDYQARVDQAKAALAAAEAQANAANAGVPLTRATTTSGTTGAAADVAAAQADYQQAQVSAREAETAGVAVAEADVASAQADSNRARADLQRMQPLLKKQEISAQQYDAYLAAERVAAAKLRAAQQRLTAARETAANKQAGAQAAAARVKQAQAALERSRANQRQVNVSAAQAKSAAAAIERAKADLEAAELDLSYTTITSPASGEVTDKTVEPGQTVQPGQQLMAIVPLRETWVTANFKETQLQNVHPGDHATVHVDMYGTDIRGIVDSIGAATGARLSLLPPENATGNFVKVVQRIPVKIVFPKLPPGIVLRPGMNVEATIYTK